MIESWRELLYPLGFLSALAFTSRMLLQWLGSETRGRSTVTPLFWKISLVGNITLALHAFIQVQFHVCVIQVCNGIISWRNLDLMRPPERQKSFLATLCIFGIGIVGTISAFSVQTLLLPNGFQDWFRIPITPWQHSQDPLNIAWHILGFFGLALFSSRFWIQWWCAERCKTSFLGPAFWWTSLLGEALCLVYFLKIHDPVNFIGPAFAMIPYIRNLMLIKRAKRSEALS